MGLNKILERCSETEETNSNWTFEKVYNELKLRKIN